MSVGGRRSPSGGGTARPVVTVPVPELVRHGSRQQLRRGDLLYRLYLVVLFGGGYGYVLVRALADAVVPPVGPDELVVAGVVAVMLPVAAVLSGVRFGRWAGAVPVTRPEASVLLPTPVDRRALLLPRLRWSVVASLVAGVGAGVVAVLLLAFNRSVGWGAWALVPAAAGVAAVAGCGVSAVAQTLPDGGGQHRRLTVVLGAVVGGVVLGAAFTPARSWFAEVGGGYLDVAAGGATVGALLAVSAGLAVLLVVAGRGRIAEAHDEELRSRAGLHGGLAASARLGDVRTIAGMRETTGRARRLASPPYPRRASGVVTWRQLTALRAHPGPVVRCAVGWVVATLLVSWTPEVVTGSGVLLRAALAAGALYAGTSPLLEPLRREHDSPLAAELLPFGFARLSWLHIRSAWLLATAIGAVSLAATLTLTPDPVSVWIAAVALLGASTVAVSAVADRVRQPGSLPEAMAMMPAGATPEVMVVAVVGMLLQPLIAMLPIALPVGLALAAGPIIPGTPGIAGTVGAVIGLFVLGLRAGGLALWLDDYEQTLQDADVLEPTSSVTLVWRRFRDRRVRRG